MRIFLFLISIAIGISSCNNNSKTQVSENELATPNFKKIDQLQWLVGTWINESEEEFSQETWSRENESSFTAYSFTQAGKKMVFAETMALEQKGENLLLTVATVNQNNEKPITFKMVSSENGQFIFENKNHDFPNRIVYTNPVKDSLHAWIEGSSNGEYKKVDFYFSRQD